ncbi:MAG TPA: hypothetical protein VF532_10695 [Candidatus Angelobacter sp.]
MEPKPSPFNRGLILFRERPVAYTVVAVLPYVVSLALVMLIGRLIVRLTVDPGIHQQRDPLTVWQTMGVGDKLLVVLAFIASATVPLYSAARGVCRMALEQQKTVHVPLGVALNDMLRFAPAAVLYFLVLGIPTFVGSQLLVVPGLMFSAACALTFPAGIDGALGPFAALRRGWSLVGRVYGRLLGAYCSYIAFVLLGWLIVAAVLLPGSSADSPPLPVFFACMGLWMLLNFVAMAVLQIIVTLLYCEARDASAPTFAAAAQG